MALRQHGVVTTSQLRQAGLDDRAIYRRVRAGRLYRLHRGVYAVGHTRISFEGNCLAAVLACRDAVLSHRSAAALWRMLPAARGPIEVTVARDTGRKRRPGITVHRSRTLTEKVHTSRLGIPVTRPARTLRDLRRALSPSAHQRAVRRALDLRLIKEQDLGPTPDLTRSELERMFLRLCRRRRLPIPEVNARVAGYEVDFLWRAHFLIAETDGFQHHGGGAAFESDRARDVRLQALGFRVLRFTYWQVRDSPDRVADSLRLLIRSGQLRLDGA